MNRISNKQKFVSGGGNLLTLNKYNVINLYINK